MIINLGLNLGPATHWRPVQDVPHSSWDRHAAPSSNKTSIEMIPMSEAILFSLKLFKQTIPLQVMTKLWKLVSDTVFFLFLFCHQ